MKRVFCRCNGGHYFVGERCPFDGWSSPELRRIAKAAKRLENASKEVSFEALRELGVSEVALKRSLIIEFSSEESAFEGFSPDYLVIDGEAVPLENLSESHL